MWEEQHLYCLDYLEGKVAKRGKSIDCLSGREGPRQDYDKVSSGRDGGSVPERSVCSTFLGMVYTTDSMELSESAISALFASTTSILTIYASGSIP